jgi:hypothetical protein
MNIFIKLLQLFDFVSSLQLIHIDRPSTLYYRTLLAGRAVPPAPSSTHGDGRQLAGPPVGIAALDASERVLLLQNAVMDDNLLTVTDSQTFPRFATRSGMPVRGRPLGFGNEDGRGVTRVHMAHDGEK